MKIFTEQDVIRRIRENERTVLGDIFFRYQRMVAGYITAHGGGEADAEDLLQEAIIVLWQNVTAGSFKLTSRLGTYLLAVVKNKWMAEMRKRKKLTISDIPETVNDGNPDSLEMILETEKNEMVGKALNTIQPVCKKLLMLFYFEERSLEEIARILNFASTDVAKARKYQCKKALEVILQKISADAERSFK